MRNRIIYSLICLTILTFVGFGCASKKARTDIVPSIGMDVRQMNSSFIIFEDPVNNNFNSHKNGEILAITAKNKSDNTIVFDPGYIKIFTKNGDDWTPVANNIQYPSVQIQLPTTKTFPPGMVKMLFPDIPNLIKPTVIRIFFIGHTQSTNENIGAYLDVPLLP
jgi:hypothetical protein